MAPLQPMHQFVAEATQKLCTRPTDPDQGCDCKGGRSSTPYSTIRYVVHKQCKRLKDQISSIRQII